MNDKSLGEIAATAAGWTWDAMPASQRAEWQRGAEAVQDVVWERLSITKEDAAYIL